MNTHLEGSDYTSQRDTVHYNDFNSYVVSICILDRLLEKMFVFVLCHDPNYCQNGSLSIH